MQARIDLRLYAVVDEDLLAGRDPAQLAATLAANGATVVQYRAKRLGSREFLRRACAMKVALAGSRVPLIINDRADIAALCGATGLHVGQDDLSITDVRVLLGPTATIGVSVSTAEEALTAQQEGADYVGAGAVFPTDTKSDAPLMGLEGLKRIKAGIRIPVVAIGGLKAGNVEETVAAGADGLAFISELMCAEDPGEVARELRRIIDAALKKR